MNTRSNDHPFTGMLNSRTPNFKTLRIALLEDDSGDTARVQNYIVSSGSQCTVYHSAMGLQEALRKVTYDVIIFDWDRHSSFNGKNIINWIRNTLNSDVPVIVTSDSTCEHTLADALYSGVTTFS